MNFGFKKKSGFTLTEISIALLIVGILVAITLPVIKKQLTKSDEFSYYLAFKTVEDIASRVATAPVDNNTEAYNHGLFPAAIADTLYEEIMIPSIDATQKRNIYDATLKNVATAAYKTKFFQSILPCYFCDNTKPTAPSSETFYICSGGKLVNHGSNLNNLSSNIYCTENIPEVPEPEDPGTGGSFEGGEGGSFEPIEEVELEYPYIKLWIPIALSSNSSASSTTVSNSATTVSGSTTSCAAGLTGITTSGACICSRGNIPSGSTCITLVTDRDFNPKTQAYCTSTEYYDYESGTCKAISSATTTVHCQPGSRANATNTECYRNSIPITAKGFCNAIADTYNIDNANCNTFASSGSTSYYQGVYNAVVTTLTEGSNSVTRINSIAIASLDGHTFSSIAPNITFANGLRMWILGDRTASIPGLTSTPDNMTTTYNMCYITSDTESSCTTSTNRYFSKDENKVDQTGMPSGLLLANASPCSNAGAGDWLNTTDGVAYTASHIDSTISYALSGFTIYVDIDGENKGDNTLWRDIFPFYIATNGRVYPAYPIDGMDDARKLGGNNPKFLPTDVYYYDASTSGDQRIKQYAHTGISYAEAMCVTKQISINSPYCLNLRESEEESRNLITGSPCSSRKCFISLRRKQMFL